MDLAGALAELYELPPEQFVERRRALAAELKKAGEVELAEEVTRARRPSLTAWAVNLAFRADPARADRLAELGSALREAQATMAGDRIRDVTAQRRRLLDELTTAAGAEAREHGHPLSGSARQEVADTLTAALVSEEALAAATSGILTRSLSYAGFGDVDVTAATATPLTGRRAGEDATAQRRGKETREPAGGGDAAGAGGTKVEKAKKAEKTEGAEERARAADRARRAEALSRAERAATRAAQALARAEEREAALSRQVDELRELLRARSEELGAAQEAVRRATAAAEQAGQELAGAQQALEQV